MRLSIVPIDGTVCVDGYAYTELDLSFIPADINALQWDGFKGEIEFVDAKEESIDTLPVWVDAALELYNNAKVEEETALELEQESTLIQSQVEEIENSFNIANTQSVQSVIDSGGSTITLTPYTRKSDNVVIGCTVGYVNGAEGLAALEVVIDAQFKYGVPLFTNVPMDMANYEKYKTYLEGKGFILIPDKYTQSAFLYPQWTLELAKARAKGFVNSNVKTEFDEGIVFQGVTYDIDETSRVNIANKAVELLLNSTHVEVTWRDKSNTNQLLTPEEFKEFASNVVSYTEQIYRGAWVTKEAIDNATTFEEVDAAWQS